MKIVFLLSLLMVQFHVPSNDALSIRNRLAQLYDPNARCKVQMASTTMPDCETSGYMSVISFIKSLTAFGGNNCSIEYVHYDEPGLPDENGTYNGAIGLIQQDRQDLAMVFVRPDALPFEPGKLTPVFSPADVTIISHRNRSRMATHELIHFLYKDPSAYAYSCIFLFFIFSSLYAFVDITLSFTKLNAKSFLKRYFRTFQQVTALLVDQEGFGPVSITGKVLCWTISVYYFVLICALLLNTIGAYLVVSIPANNINSLDDLLQHTLQPYIVKNLFLYELLKASPPHSKLHQLWLRTGAVNKGIFFMNANNRKAAFEDIGNLLGEISSSSSALVVQNYAFDIGLRTSLCMYYPEMENSAQAKELFAPGIVTGLMSSKTHPFVQKVISYIFTSIFETQLITGLVRNSIADSQSMFSLAYNSRVIKCAESTTEFLPQEPFFAPFKLTDMASLFIAYLVLSLSSLIPFAFSLCYSHFATIRRQKRRVHLVPLFIDLPKNVSICRVAQGRINNPTRQAIRIIKVRKRNSI